MKADRWQIYTAISFLLSSVCIGNSYNQIYNNPINPASDRFLMFLKSLLSTKINILVLMNMAVCLLFLFGKVVQILFFGKLRDIEAKNLYDRLLHYVLFKVVFLGAILEPGTELFVYIACFSMLGFMKLFTLLTRDRYEYITTFNPNSSKKVHIKLITLLLIITVCDIAWFIFCYKAFSKAGSSNWPGRFLLITFECFTVFLDTIQTLIKYVIYLIDTSREGIWEERGTYIYYTEFCTDILVLVATIGHYLQILLMHGVSPTLIDLVLFLHLRVVWNNLREKIASYRNYRKLAQNMKTRYPDVSGEQLASMDDICAICHDRMEVAKKLPCNHIFHHSCLRSWLEHHSNCPTCRYSLIDTNQAREGPAPIPIPVQHNDPGLGLGVGNINPNIPIPMNRPPGNPQNREELFRFNGPRWLSWLPTIQVVSERHRFNPHQHPHHHEAIFGAELNNNNGFVPPEWINQLFEIFPHIPRDSIREDLARTRSIEITTENIMEGRIIIPLQRQEELFAPPEMVQNPPQSPIINNQNLPTQQFNNVNANASIFSNIDVSGLKEEDIKTNFADTFATSSQERQNKFNQRKQAMIDAARKQFVLKQQPKEVTKQNNENEIQSNSNSNSNSNNGLISRTNSNTNNNSNSNFLSNSNLNSSSFTSSSSSSSSSNNSTMNSRMDAMEDVDPISSSSSSVTVPETLEQRRKLMLEAAQRRQATIDKKNE